MELFLIIIIIILAYLLLKKKNNKTVEGLEKKADVYGKALKNAGSSFMNTLNEERVVYENPSDEIIDLKDFDNLQADLKEAVENTSRLLKELYTGALSTNNEYSLYSQKFLRDELIVSFNGVLIAHSLKPYTNNISKSEKGIAVAKIFYNISIDQWLEINDDFIRLAFNPTNNSRRGTELSNKLIDIIENINVDKWDYDNDIILAKDNMLMLDRSDRVLTFDNVAQPLMTSFFHTHIGEYLEKYKKNN